MKVRSRLALGRTEGRGLNLNFSIEINDYYGDQPMDLLEVHEYYAISLDGNHSQISDYISFTGRLQSLSSSAFFEPIVL